MTTSEKIKSEMDWLLDQQQKLIDLCRDNKNIIDFGTAYQKWYSKAYKIVEALAPERIQEFSGYYLIDPKRKTTDAGNYTIQDYIKGIGARTDGFRHPLWDTNNLTGLRILNQVQILAALTSRIDSVLQDVTGHLFAELQDSELAAATQLKKISKRAAGALAGVVLERHLQRAAQNRQIKIGKKNPTISDLNDPLKSADAYDQATWRKIQLLADIRNMCSHQKSTEPSEDQVNELITGVNAIIKSIF